MKDGGQVALDWHIDSIDDPNRPILFFMPGSNLLFFLSFICLIN